MPIESSKPQVGRNLGLDFGAYLQGKAFTRSVSISESVPVDSGCATSSDSTAILSASGRFASGGACATTTQPSPSPLSSTTATVSPESPLPSNAPAGVAGHPLKNLEFHGVPREIPVSCVDESSEKTTSSVPTPSDTLPSCSTVTNPSSLRVINPYAPEFCPLFQDPLIQRTVSLLSHLIDSRLTSEWREAFLNKTSSAVVPESSSATFQTSQLPINSGILYRSADTTDSTSVSIRRPIPPTPSPSEDVSVVKRFKDNELKASKLPSQPRHITPSPSCQLSVSSSFIPLRLASCVRRLADHFEWRYRDKLGDLLEDVARLSHSTAEDDSGFENNGAPASATDDTAQSSNSPKGLEAARYRFHHVLSELFMERINWGRVVAMLAFVRALCEHVEQAARPPTSGNLRRSTPHAVSLGNSTESTSLATTATDQSCQSSCDSECTQNTVESTENASQGVLAEINTVSTAELNLASDDVFPPIHGLRAAHYVAWTAEFIHGPHGIWDWIVANGGWDGLVEFESERGIHDTAQVADRSMLGLTDDDAMRLLRRAVTGVATIAVGAVGLVAALRFFTKRL